MKQWSSHVGALINQSPRSPHCTLMGHQRFGKQAPQKRQIKGSSTLYMLGRLPWKPVRDPCSDDVIQGIEMAEYLLCWSRLAFSVLVLVKSWKTKPWLLSSVPFLILRVGSQNLRAAWSLDCEYYKRLLSLRGPVRREQRRELHRNVNWQGMWTSPQGFFSPCLSLPCSDWLELDSTWSPSPSPSKIAYLLCYSLLSFRE